MVQLNCEPAVTERPDVGHWTFMLTPCTLDDAVVERVVEDAAVEEVAVEEVAVDVAIVDDLLEVEVGTLDVSEVVLEPVPAMVVVVATPPAALKLEAKK